MRYLLDTNTCTYIIKKSPASVHKKFMHLRVGDVGISAITFCELQYGVSKSDHPKRNQRALTEFLGPLDILDFPSAATPVFGRIRAGLEQAGAPTGNYDLLIALHLGVILGTNNVREFRRVPGLKVENWI